MHRSIVYDNTEGPCPVCELKKKTDEQEKELLELYRKVNKYGTTDSGAGKQS
jgi:hypothetical protein